MQRRNPRNGPLLIGFFVWTRHGTRLTGPRMEEACPNPPPLRPGPATPR